ncbi:MAG: DUF1493 family protein [Pantoea sp.]|nr:DUF1493 family protein [Pantoea sp.]
MVTDDEVLAFFRRELPVLATLRFKPIPLKIDDILQEYAPADDLLMAIDKYDAVFNVDVSPLNLDDYYPWEIPWFFRQWFTQKPVIQTRKPLSVRMFAESARAGRWLYSEAISRSTIK